jgi:hypothetical protein
MPLIEGKSDKARSENIATEMREGKPPAQAKAIGYAVQRKAGGKDTAAVDGYDVQAALMALTGIADGCMAADKRKRK